jgi:hypothetical protein
MKKEIITLEELKKIQAKGVTLEQDGRGIKVSLLENGQMLKVFRIRSKFTLARYWHYAERFVRNAERLSCRKVATITPVKLYQVANTTEMAVEYLPLPGNTVRQLFKIETPTLELLHGLACFIAELHAKGIYFRSLHLGNIVRMPTGEFGLIDIADMRVFAWSLHFFTRLRNFDRIKKYDEDMQHLSHEARICFINAYAEQAGYSGARLKRIINHLC